MTSRTMKTFHVVVTAMVVIFSLLVFGIIFLSLLYQAFDDSLYRWVYLDRKGQRAFDGFYLDARPFSEGLAAVKSEAGWHFIDRKGLVVVKGPFHYAYSFTGDGLALVQTGYDHPRPKSYGYVNKQGSWAIEPIYARATFFQEGYANVGIISKHRSGGADYSWGIIDKHGEVIVKPKEHDHPKRVEEAKPFASRLAPIRIASKWGYWDPSGQIIISPQYQKAEPFQEGLAMVKQNHQTGFIKPDQTFQIPLAHGYINEISEGVIRGCEESCGFYDLWGKQLFPGEFHYAHDFSEGLASVTPDGFSWGFIDQRGRYLIPAIYRRAESFSEGLVAVANDDYLYGFIDRAGKAHIPHQCKDVRPFREGLAACQLDVSEEIKEP